jgi:hypothetical protein
MNASALHYSEQRLPVPQADQTECRCFTVIDGDEMFGLPVESVQTIFRSDRRKSRVSSICAGASSPRYR